MHWTHEEIRTSYRDARCKRNQISVLAQLNGCATDEIKVILGLIEPTEVKTDEIAPLYNQGLSDTDIMKRLGISNQQVLTWRTQRNLKVNRPIRGDRKRYFELYKKGLTDKEIADIVGTTTKTVTSFRSAYGLERNKKRGERRG